MTKAAKKDWREATLARMRKLIEKAVPDVVEEIKWRKPSNPDGVPVWSYHGILCTGETYKDHVKLTFANGAKLKDPRKLFNAGLEGGTRRAIDLQEGDKVDADAFVALVRDAADRNEATKATKAKKPKLLSGDNPQIPMGYGDEPVAAYLEAIPGWKRAVASRIDEVVARSVPGVRKAVKWNSPFYGVEDDRWFLNMHCFTKYVKVTFFQGTSLDPPPPGASKMKGVRFYDVHDGELDEKQLAAWVKQAAKLPGVKM